MATAFSNHQRHRGRATGLHEEAGCWRARAAFLEIWGEELGMVRAAEKFRARQRAIAQLDVKDWHGVLVYRLRCDGPFGNGPHDVWVPERVLWSLIALERFSCPYHR